MSTRTVIAVYNSIHTVTFINKKFVKKHNVRTRPLKQRIPVLNINGTPNTAGMITDIAILDLEIGDYKEKSVFTIMDIGLEDVIIGIN